MYSCDPGSFRSSGHLSKTDELRDDSSQLETIHLSRGSSTTPILHSRSSIVTGGKERNKGRLTIFFTLLMVSTAMQMKQNQKQISRNQEKHRIKFIGDMIKMQCTGFTCP